jgi:CheY-like chemotaxis protein
MTDSKSARVLVVEDNDSSAGDYRRWLEAARFVTERASAASEALVKAEQFRPDVVLLDLQLPSEPGQADEDVEHGLSTLSRLLDAEPFRPIVVVTAHSRDRDLMRRVFQRTHGGQFVFKDAEELERELLKAVDVALASPAFRMSRTVAEFKQLLEQKQEEDAYRKFIHKHWEVFLGPEYREVQSPYPITRGGNIDLLAIRHDGFPDLWELKRPDDPVFKEYNQWLHHSLECSRAIGQLMEYYDAAQREPRPGLRHYDARRGVDMELHRPRGFVVIGRTKNAQERERLRLENSFLAGISILTYDDLVERAKHLLTFLQRYRNGDAPEV